MRHALEDREEQTLLEKAATVVARLDLGRNHLEPDDFVLAARFFLSGKKLDEAVECGSFRVKGRIEIVRVRSGAMITVSEIARQSGLPQKTVWRWVTNANLPFTIRGRQKLYNIQDLRDLLVTHGE
jgi:hypothetical protein